MIKKVYCDNPHSPSLGSRVCISSRPNSIVEGPTKVKKQAIRDASYLPASLRLGNVFLYFTQIADRFAKHRLDRQEYGNNTGVKTERQR